MRLKTILSIALLALAGANAYAQERIVHLTSVGQISKIATTSRSTPDVASAAKTIAPHGWQGFFKTNVDVSKKSKLTTVKNELWTIALDRWLEQEGLKAGLDWEAQRIYFELETAAPSKIAAAQAPAAQGAAVVAPVVAAPEPKAESADSNWTVKVTDLRLENTLTRWAEKAGYKLLWDADRHILITAEDTFSGDFMVALDRILTSPAIRESDYPVEAVVYANNPPLIRITRLGEQAAN